jgi:hypothetical protein
MTYFNELLDWLSRKSTEEQATRVSPRGKAGVKSRFEEMSDALYEVRTDLLLWFDVYIRIAALKDMVCRALNRTSKIATYAVMDNGAYVPTNPEGYVVTAQNQMVKLVIRREFSRLNFQTMLSSQ